MTKYTNPAHIDNFVSYADVKFVVYDITDDEIATRNYFQIASGKTLEEAKERFYMRYMIRTVDHELIESAQRRNNLYIGKLTKGFPMVVIKRNAQLIFLA